MYLTHIIPLIMRISRFNYHTSIISFYSRFLFIQELVIINKLFIIIIDDYTTIAVHCLQHFINYQ